jgi:pilus assembly protein CpaB
MVATMNARRTTLIVAVALALGTGWLTLTYLSNLQRQTNANSAPVQVIVAAQEIPPRVPITAAMLGRATRPTSAIDPNAMTDPKQVVGALSLITIPAGSSVTSAMIGHPADIGLPVRMARGMRAVSVQIDKVKGISGLVEPGDRVDVIAQPPKANSAPPPASAILRGVRVLAIGDSLENSSATPSPQEANATTVTLEVTPKQADLLVMADLNTTLRLALRSPKEPLNSEPTEALHFDGPNSAPAAAPPAAAPGAGAVADSALLKALIQTTPAPQGAGANSRAQSSSAAQVDETGVRVIDGDHYAGATGAGQSQ